MPVESAFDVAVRFHQEGNLDGASELYRRILQSEPHHAGALHLLGVMCHHQGDHAASIKLIGQAVAIKPQNAVYWSNYGLSLHSLGRFSEALDAFTRALEIHPPFPQALANLGMAQRSLGQLDAASASFGEALKLEPYHPDALIKLAQLLEATGRAREAISLYEEGIHNAPRLEFYVNFGALLVSTGMSEMAVAPLRAAIDLSPGCMVAYLNLGAAYHALGNNAGAFASLRKAFELEPNGRESPKRLSILLDALATQPRTSQAKAMRSSPVDNFVQVVSTSDCKLRSFSRTSELANDAASPFIYDCVCDVSAKKAHRINPHGRKIAFASPHCILDFTNGAATATLDGLKLLMGLGFDCHAFCGSRLDAPDEAGIEDALAQRGDRFVARNARLGPFRGRMYFTSHGEMPVTLVDTSPTQDGRTQHGSLNHEEIAAFISGCKIFLNTYRPDLVWTYGGDPLSLVVQQIAKQQGIPILFALHNFSYTDAAPFQTADCVVVPTEFARQHYADKLGLATVVLAPVLDPMRIGILKPSGRPHSESDTVGESSTRYVTFINPEPRKGVVVYARIAEILAERRPDIPLLLVEGASKATVLSSLGIDLAALINVRVMPNTPDARQFLAATKLLLMPSLIENAAMVAREAMFNGIPVLASNRGGLPETIGDAGILFDIPARYTPETRDLPTAEEVEPWVETIIRLWDDTAEYERCSQAAREHAQQWHPERLAPIYRDFFGSLLTA